MLKKWTSLHMATFSIEINFILMDSLAEIEINMCGLFCVELNFGDGQYSTQQCQHLRE